MMVSNLPIFSLLAFCCGNIAVHAAGPCTTPDGDDGRCIPLEECKSLLSAKPLINTNTENQEFLDKSEEICKIGNYAGEVCCPFEEFLSSFVPDEETDDDEPTSGQYKLPLPPDCGTSMVENNHRRIMGGVPVMEGEFPWMAALGYGSSFNTFKLQWRCGGVLITPRHILTAAHCIIGFENELKVARFGTINAFDQGKAVDRRFAGMYIHEEYNRTTKNHDIAILKLKKEIVHGTERVGIICLPLEKSLRENKWLRYNPFVAGWGLIDFENKDSSSPVMLTTQVPVVRNSFCESAYEGKSWNSIEPNIDDNIICAGYRDGKHDACTGDSGGPLMLPRQVDGISKYFSIGVVSYGFKCGEPGYPNVYTRVSKYIEWIESKLNL